MNKIKEYTELTAILLKDDSIITTPMSLQDVANLLSSSEFVIIGDKWFNKFEVRTFEKFNPTEMDNFILSKPKEVAKKLRDIISERQEKWLKINWTKHLWEIYESRYS